ncbi:hypothetical protein EYF80_054480 [Liparis tanakae]|uniref:Uncharacterized protein n=1 Tax=Liparis tanakae TaxID=230148 RepID=A0A4Z2F2J2_9TELE|nr:hypothetical protein EYF80_054480 [Liparis tanakae]
MSRVHEGHKGGSRPIQGYRGDIEEKLTSDPQAELESRRSFYSLYCPEMMSARLVSTLPSMNLATASTAHVSPLTMATLYRKSSCGKKRGGGRLRYQSRRKR